MKDSFNTTAPIPKRMPQNVTIGGKKKMPTLKILRKIISKLLAKKLRIVNVILKATQINDILFASNGIPPFTYLPILPL
jgi:hypothetical protein